jgi:hypothetical protein
LEVDDAQHPFPIDPQIHGVLAAAIALATVTMGTPAFAESSADGSATPAVLVPAYTSHCGEPPVPDTPINDGPEGIFGTPCAHHDVCYSRGTTRDRYTCGVIFLGEMVRACDSHYSFFLDPRRPWCEDLAAGYFAAVRVFGRFYWEGPPNKNN